MQRGRLLIEWLLIGIGASLIVILAVRTSFLDRADRLVYDLAAPLYAPATDDRILIAAIDNEAIAALGRWPWPRKAHADAIAAIDRHQPAAIIYDVLFLEPSPDDPALAQSMEASDKTFLPLLFETPGPNGAPYYVREPAHRLAQAAKGLGTVNLILDSDGQARRIAIATRAEPAALPHIAELAYRQMQKRPSPAFLRTNASDDPLWIAFRAPGSFRTVSLISLIRGEVPDALIRNKLVIVGATAEGLGDLHPVSASGGALMAGAEVQANLLSSLLADRFISPLPMKWLYLMALAPVWLLLIAFLRLAPSRGLMLSLATTALLISLSVLLLATGGIWAPPMAALLGIAIVYPLWGWRRLAAVTQFMEREVHTLLAETGIGEPEQDGGWRDDRVGSDASRLHMVIAVMRRNAEEREEMLQFLSHDMRSPQAAIIALIDGAPDRADPKLLARVRGNAERTLQLADDFVQLTRMESRRSDMHPVDLADAMAQARDIIWPKAQARKQQIIHEPSGNELWVYGDDAALVRAFSNLLNNAVEAAPEGGTILCGVTREDGHAIAYVEDNGPGLPPERREDPFARFGYSTRHRQDGTAGAGLGLAFVRAVALQHGGDAQYHDGKMGGARFSLRLPIAPDEE